MNNAALFIRLGGFEENNYIYIYIYRHIYIFYPLAHYIIIIIFPLIMEVGVLVEKKTRMAHN